MIHDLSEVMSSKIGKGTKIWQFVVVLEGAEIGKDCNINCHCFIENDVIIGNNVTIKSGVYIWDGVTLEDQVFIGPNVVFTNDLLPRSKRNFSREDIRIGYGASIGANSTILAGVSIGKYAMTGIASVITKNLPDYSLSYGNPAKVVGWVDEEGRKLKEVEDGVYQALNGQHFKLFDGVLKKLS